MRRTLPALAVAVGVAVAVAAQPPKDPPKLKAGPAFEQTPYGKTPARKDDKGKTVPGEIVTEYTLVNRNGVTLKCVDYGAIITELHVPDKNGTGFDVVFVETIGRGTGAAYKRVYLNRRAVTWPSDEL